MEAVIAIVSTLTFIAGVLRSADKYGIVNLHSTGGTGNNKPIP